MPAARTDTVIQITLTGKIAVTSLLVDCSSGHGIRFQILFEGASDDKTAWEDHKSCLHADRLTVLFATCVPLNLFARFRISDDNVPALSAINHSAAPLSLPQSFAFRLIALALSLARLQGAVSSINNRTFYFSLEASGHVAEAI